MACCSDGDAPANVCADRHLGRAPARRRGAAARRLSDAPGHALAADFTRRLALPPAAGRRVGFFPGSSFGNFTPDDALAFLRATAAVLERGLLIGVDLVKYPARLYAAYNDAAGVTADFNLNLLARANRELGADFDLASFDHYAFYEPRQQRIEMHLVSRRAQTVHLCGQAFGFDEGEPLHTENSYKYTVEQFHALARKAGYRPEDRPVPRIQPYPSSTKAVYN